MITEILQTFTLGFYFTTHRFLVSPPPLSSWRGLFCVTLSTYVYLLYGPAAAGTTDEYGHWLLPPSLALPSSNTMGLIVHATHTHTQRGLYSGAECRFPHHMPHLHWNVIIFPRHREE